MKFERGALLAGSSLIYRLAQLTDAAPHHRSSALFFEDLLQRFRTECAQKEKLGIPRTIRAGARSSWPSKPVRMRVVRLAFFG